MYIAQGSIEGTFPPPIDPSSTHPSLWFDQLDWLNAMSALEMPRQQTNLNRLQMVAKSILLKYLYIFNICAVSLYIILTIIIILI